jgi:hypothetical protein
LGDALFLVAVEGNQSIEKDGFTEESAVTTATEVETVVSVEEGIQLLKHKTKGRQQTIQSIDRRVYYEV